MCSYHEGSDQSRVITSLHLYNQPKLSTKQTVYDTDRSHVKLYCTKTQVTHSLLFLNLLNLHQVDEFLFVS